MEGMLDNLSQPVAFTTAPLGTETGSSGKRGVQRDGSSGSETEREAPLVSKFSRKLGLDGRPKSSMLLSGQSVITLMLLVQNKMLSSKKLTKKFLQTMVGLSTNKIGSMSTIKTIGDDLSESFCLIPLESEPATSALKKENISLRQEIEEMQNRLAEAERVLQLRKEQDQLLRDSIVMARHQVGPYLSYRIHAVNFS